MNCQLSMRTSRLPSSGKGSLALSFISRSLLGLVMSMSYLNFVEHDGKKLSFPFNGGRFRMTTLKWPDWCVYMQSNAEGNVRGWAGLPGYQGEFIFTPLEDSGDLFLISTRCWPHWYMYMQDNSEGNVRGWEGDPGPQGHWRITPNDDGSVLLSTAKWKHWYMYMQDTKTGNVRGYHGNPGPQGHFVLSCDVKLTNRPS